MQSNSKPTAPHAKSTSGRLTAKQRQAQTRQQQQWFVLVTVGIAVLVLVVIAFALLRNPAPNGSDAQTRYAGIPSGVTTSGPLANISYPAPMPYLGSPEALVKIEEIGSFSCPVCLDYHDSKFNAYFDEIQAGHLQFIYLPTTLTGDFNAVPGTQAAYCAIQQQPGKFWPLYDLLFDAQQRYGADAARRDHLDALAKQINLDSGPFDTCLDSSPSTSFVRTADDYANQRGLRGTPTIFLYAKGQQITSTQIGPNQTPGDMSSLSSAQIKTLIDNTIKGS